MEKTAEKRFNLAFNIFLVTGMIVAVTITTIFKLQQPEVKTFMLLLAAFGSVMGVINTVLSANGHLLTFLFGLLDVLAATVVLYDNGIMGNFALHAFYFLPMQFIGFAQWKKRGAEAHKQVKARRLNGRQWMLYSGLFVIGTIVVYLILSAVDKEAAGQFLKVAVLMDAVSMVCNILGQYLLSTAYMEQWVFWILVNISSVVMWTISLRHSSDPYSAIYMVKYAFYLLNSFNGLRIWMGLSKKTASLEN